MASDTTCWPWNSGRGGKDVRNIILTAWPRLVAKLLRMRSRERGPIQQLEGIVGQASGKGETNIHLFCIKLHMCEPEIRRRSVG